MKYILYFEGEFFMPRVVSCLAFTVFFFNSTSFASAQDRYCGVHAVFGAACIFGKKVEIEDLLSERFVTSFEGSTLKNLVDAAEFCGLNGRPLKNLTRSSLESTKTPLILHVCSDHQFVAHNHWVLFMGMQNGEAIVNDEKGRSEAIPLSLVLSRWDGIALCIWDQPTGSEQTFSRKFSSVETSQWAVWLALTVLSVVLIRTKRAAGIITIAFALLAYHSVFSPVGYTKNTEVVRHVSEVMRNANFPGVEYDELKDRLTDSRGLFIVDARNLKSARGGMIPSAVNLPLNLTYSELHEALNDTPRDLEVIVYCQSDRCSFHRILGLRLLGEGFRNVKLYSGGWNEWSIENNLR